MTYNPARPKTEITFAGTSYELHGTFELIEAVENAFHDSILQITVHTPTMGMSDTAKLLSAMLKASGHNLPYREVASSLFKSGIWSPAFSQLKSELYAFLRVTLEPPELREKMEAAMGEITGKSPASRGDSTKSSVSASSGGNPPPSGEQPSGT